jgi:hypothetical protein
VGESEPLISDWVNTTDDKNDCSQRQLYGMVDVSNMTDTGLELQWTAFNGTATKPIIYIVSDLLEISFSYEFIFKLTIIFG